MFMKIGIMGGKGSFNDEVVKKFIKKHRIENAEIKYLYTTENVLKGIISNEIDRGVFGIYNSKSLLVDETIKVMGHYLYDVISYETLFVRHFLMTLPNIKLDDIKTISGHPEAIVQCKKTIKKKYFNLDICSGLGDRIDSTAVTESLINGEISKNTAILGSSAIAESFNLTVRDKDLQDNSDNTTTFLFIKKFE